MWLIEGSIALSDEYWLTNFLFFKLFNMGIFKYIYKSRGNDEPTYPSPNFNSCQHFAIRLHLSLTSVLSLSWNYFKPNSRQYFISPLNTFIMYVSQVKTFFLPPPLFLSLFYFLCIYSFNWSIVDLQCVNYYCTAKWLSYTYIYILFLIFFSIMVYHRSVSLLNIPISIITPNTIIIPQL